MRAAGLSITGPRVAAAIVERRFRNVSVAARDEFTLPEDEHGRANALSDALTRYKSERAIDCVAVGLDMSYFSHHIVELPFTRRPEIASALRFEMEKHLPLPPDEYVFDFHTMSSTPGSSRNLVLSIKRERLGWITRAAAQAGVRIASVRSSMAEALSAFAASHNTQDVIFAYAEPGMLALAGMRGFEIAEFRLARLTGAGGGAPPPQVADMASSFARGLYLSGQPEGLTLPGMTRIHTPAEDTVAESVWARRGMGMDFTPPELKRPARDIYPMAAGVLAGLCALTFVLTSALGYYKDQAALQSVRASLNEIRQTSIELIAVRNELEDIKTRKRFINEFRAARNRNIRALSELSAIVPKDSWLTVLNADEIGVVEIQGYAVRSADLIRLIEQSATFKNVEFTSPVTVMGDRERFSIRMEMAR